MHVSLFVGNLHYDATEQDVKAAFVSAGYEPKRVRIINDRDTGESRGFGFVEIDPDMAEGAIDDLNGVKINGRSIQVREARDKKARAEA